MLSCGLLVGPTQDRILLSLEDVFEEVKKKEGILQADMPNVEVIRVFAGVRSIDVFPRISVYLSRSFLFIENMLGPSCVFLCSAA